MEAPQIHQFYDGRPHPADDLNEMGIAVLDLVAKVNELEAQLAKCQSACENRPAKNPAAPAKAGRTAAK